MIHKTINGMDNMVVENLIKSKAQLIEAARKERVPLNCSLDVTTRCNLQCVHCYLGGTKRRHMPRALALRRLCELSEVGALWLTLTGGEPLLSPQFEEIYKAAYELGFLTTVYSNGTLLAKENLNILSESPPELLQISMYGSSQSTYEQVTRRQGSWVLFNRGIDAALTSGIPLGIKYVLLRQNASDLAKARDFANSIQAAFAIEAIISPTLTGSAQPCKHRLPVETLANIQSEGFDVLPRPNNRPSDSRDAFNCEAGRTMVHVDDGGKPHPCMMFRRSVDGPRPNGFAQEWAQMAHLRLKRLPAASPCATCSILAMCGICPGWRQISRVPDGGAIDYLCSLAYIQNEASVGEGKEWIRKRIRTQTEHRSPRTRNRELKEWQHANQKTRTKPRKINFADSSQRARARNINSGLPLKEIDSAARDSKDSKFVMQHYKLAEGVFLRRLGSQYVVVARYLSANGSLFTINQTGFYILSCIARDPMTLHEIADKLAIAFGIDVTNAFRDSRSFLHNLIDVDIVNSHASGV